MIKLENIAKYKQMDISKTSVKLPINNLTTDSQINNSINS